MTLENGKGNQGVNSLEGVTDGRLIFKNNHHTLCLSNVKVKRRNRKCQLEASAKDGPSTDEVSAGKAKVIAISKNVRIKKGK